MHVYFSGIGGTGIGPLALIAKQAGYEVSGSDEKDSQYTAYLKEHGISDIQVGQLSDQISAVHSAKPIDWFVYTSALSSDNQELSFSRQNGIKTSKRDEFLNNFMTDKNLKLVAISGTHGKTTTTAMAVWLFKQLGLPVSYSVGAKISFGDMGAFDPASEYFVYEADEFDRNFLAFHPYMSLITGLGWDHHEIYPTQDDYFNAFKQFLDQSEWKILWQKDMDQLGIQPDDRYLILSEADPQIDGIKLAGLYNRRDAYLVAQVLHELTKEPIDKLLNLLSIFPGVSRRFEKIVENLYSDYAHTPEKIIGAMSVAKETAELLLKDQKRQSSMPGEDELKHASEPYQEYGERGLEVQTKPGTKRTFSGKIVVVYEPLTNRRMHYTKDQHHSVFDGASKVYWAPSYLAREDPNQAVLEPAELICSLNSQLQTIAKPVKLDNELKEAINKHLSEGDLVLALSGGGGGSLDEWIRQNFGLKT